MKILDLSDTHLYNEKDIEYLIEQCKNQEMPDICIHSGDIGNMDMLRKLVQCIQLPIFYIYGNHDFYHKSIGKCWSKYVPDDFLCYIHDSIPKRLGNGITLMGHNGWYDGRAGNYMESSVSLNDFLLIEEFHGLGRSARLCYMQSLADTSVNYINEHLEKCLGYSETVIFVTHVPPFWNASTYMGIKSNADYAPYFVNQGLGDRLLEIMNVHPDKKLVVLCGHTHDFYNGKFGIHNNIEVYVGCGSYNLPEPNPIIEIGFE